VKKQRNKEAKKVTLVGFISNLFLTFCKLLAGLLGNSAAMVADAIHSISDFVTDIIVLFSIGASSRPRDHNHKYGHGKIETLATAFIGGILLFVGFGLLYSAAKSIHQHFSVEPLVRPGMIAFYAAILSMAVKEVLFRYTIVVGENIKSKVVVANAWHHRSDVFTSLATLVGIGGAIFLGPKWVILDPLAAIFVSFYILKIAFVITKETLSELIETSLSSETEKEILNIADSVVGVRDPHNLKTRSIGNDIAIEMHVYVDPVMNVQRAHELTVEIENKLFERFGQDTHVSIHVEPFGE